MGPFLLDTVMLLGKNLIRSNVYCSVKSFKIEMTDLVRVERMTPSDVENGDLTCPFRYSSHVSCTGEEWWKVALASAM